MTEPAGLDETLDILCDGKLKIVQPQDGYRFSIDALLLANFVHLKKDERLLDIGSGCGIIPIYLTKRGYTNQMVGVEIQGRLHEASLRSKAINGCDNVDFIRHDIRESPKELKKHHFHVIVSNPPFTKARSGRQSPRLPRLVARYETSLTLPTLVSVSSSLLHTRGRFCIIYPSRRLGELIWTAKSGNLELKRLRFVHPRRNEKANLFLAEFMKEGGVGATVEQPLYIYDDSKYTEEVEHYYRL